jgi:N-acyl amino acid synthase of PEP-CTERM/exosortase system
MGDSSLADIFGQYFNLVLASTPDTRQVVFRVRGDVYCREFGYERPEDCPGGLESDRYDKVSRHCLILHRGSGKPAGCVRLVQAKAKEEHASLPLERACGESLRNVPFHPENVPEHQRCEISRLAVHTVFRRRPKEQISPLGDVNSFDFSEQEKRTFPLLSVALFLAATSLVVRTRRDHVYAMMEPRLARLLRRSGLLFDQISDVMEYHGLRAAYHIHIRDALGGMNSDLRDLYGWVDTSLERDWSENAAENACCANGGGLRH